MNQYCFSVNLYPTRYNTPTFTRNPSHHMYQLLHRESEFVYHGKSKFSLKGYSRSAYKTGFLVQPFNIYLDAGLDPTNDANVVLISHTHYDHIASLYPIVLAAKNPTVLMPKSCIKGLQTMLTTLSSVSKCSMKTTIPFSEWNPVPCDINTTYPVNLNGKKMMIETFRLSHRVPCLGYGIYEERSKLKGEYLQLTGKEIVKIKKERPRHDMFEIVNIPVLLFISDTDSSILHTLPFSKFRYVLIECTFIEPEHLNEAHKRAHLHFSQLEPYIKEHTSTTFILIHFSQRYKNAYLESKEAEIKQTYPNIIFWI